MTITAEPQTSAQSPSPARALLQRIVFSWWTLPIGSALLAFAVRAIGLGRSFELWVDEMLYADLGASVSRGEFPNLPDGPFFLHPPGFFLIEGAVIRLFGLSTSDSMDLVYDLRWLSATLGAVSVGVVALLLRRLAGGPIAWAGALIMVFEPFVLRNNSRVFLETAAGLAALAGLLVLVTYLRRPPAQQTTGRLVAAGLLLGYAVVTKDTMAFYALVPVVLAVLWRRTLRPRAAGTVLAAAAVPYAVYLLALAWAGHLGDWAWAKGNGLVRLVGLDQSTGFNAPDAPSLVDRLFAQLGQYGTSYLLLLACPLAGALACTSARPERRLIGLTALCMGALGGYLAVFGTFEEQYGYPVMLAGITALAAAVAELRERRPAIMPTVVRIGAVFVVLTAVLGMRAELTADNGYQQFRAWAADNLSADATVSVTNSTAQWAFSDDPRFGVWPTAQLLQQNDVHYILTQSLTAEQGYDFESPEMLDWLEQNATPVFEQSGSTNGETVLWFIDQEALDAGAKAGVGGTATVAPDGTLTGEGAEQTP